MSAFVPRNVFDLFDPGALVKRHYSGVIDALVATWNREGVLAHFRGNASHVLAMVPSPFIKFTTYGVLKQWLPGPVSDLSREVTSSAAAGMVTVAVTYPLRLISTRLAADTALKGEARRYRGIIDCLRQTSLQSSGLRSLYQGMTVAMLAFVPYQMIYLVLYDEGMRRVVTAEGQLSYGRLLVQMSTGSIAAFAATLGTYPMYTLSKRLRMNGVVGTAVSYANARDCLVTMMKQEGWRSLYRGVAADAVKVPGRAVQLVLFDVFSKWRS